MVENMQLFVIALIIFPLIIFVIKADLGFDIKGKAYKFYLKNIERYYWKYIKESCLKKFVKKILEIDRPVGVFLRYLKHIKCKRIKKRFEMQRGKR